MEAHTLNCTTASKINYFILAIISGDFYLYVFFLLVGCWHIFQLIFQNIGIFVVVCRCHQLIIFWCLWSTTRGFWRDEDVRSDWKIFHLKLYEWLKASLGMEGFFSTFKKEQTELFGVRCFFLFLSLRFSFSPCIFFIYYFLFAKNT